MRNILVLIALLVSVNVVAKPKIRIIATGGTIAGVSQSATSSAYSAGQVGVQTLIDAVHIIPKCKDGVKWQQLGHGKEREDWQFGGGSKVVRLAHLLGGVRCSKLTQKE